MVKSHWTLDRLSFVLLFISFCLTLNGCMSSHHRDGPPNFYVDERKIPNAVPKLEPLSRIGNKSTYTVFGKHYNVMPTSYAYNEVGIASWYGTMFHSHHTSNGELYDMLAMTAAHKSLPLPTYVEVTNLKNRKKVIVKVNDRGPFEANRIIDLSYVAAKKLGMLGHGTTLVRVKSIDPRDAFAHPELMARKQNYVPSLRINPRAHIASTGQVHLPHYAPRQFAHVQPQHFTPKTAHHPVRHFVRGTPNVPPGVHRVASRNVPMKKIASLKRSKPSTRTIQDVSAHTLALNTKTVYIQVGAFKNPNYARTLKAKLLAYTHAPVNINPSKHYYRVQIGPLKDIATATKLTRQLLNNGIHIQKMGYRDDRIVNDFDIT